MPEPFVAAARLRRRGKLPLYVAGGLLAALTLVAGWIVADEKLSLRWDEPWTLPVVRGIVESGWAWEALVDYNDAKGPSFYVTYAAVAQFLGKDLETLRWVSRVCFLLSGLTLLCVWSRSGLSGRRLLLAALALVVTPYAFVLAQLAMSEASFMLGVAGAVALYTLGTARGGSTVAATTAQLLYGLLLLVLLHHRPQVIVWVAAISIVALSDLGYKAWPWLTVGALSVALRLPLLLYWGGLTPPAYGGAHNLGLNPENVGYLLASSVPLTLISTLSFLATAARRTIPLTGIQASAVFGALVGIGSSLRLATAGEGLAYYLGPLSRLLQYFGAGLPRSTVLVALSSVGAMGVWVLLHWVLKDGQWAHVPPVFRIGTIALPLGILSYVVETGFVFDRYLLGFGFLLPGVWARELSGPWRTVNVLVLAFIAVPLAIVWLC